MPPQRQLLITLRLFALFVLLVACTISASAGLFDEKIINRPNEKSGFLGMGVTRFYAHVISNMPQAEVMRIVCKTVLNRSNNDKDHCQYHSLAEVGRYGKKKRDFLPYNFEENAETIVIIDRSTITEAELKALEMLQTRLFRLMPPVKTAGAVRIWIQNAGENGKEYQVFLDIPHARWLEKATNDLWNISTDAIADKSKDTISIERTLSVGYLLTNDATVRDRLIQALPYCDWDVCGIEDFDRFRDATNVSKKIIALNWNGDAEFTPVMATQVFPPSLKGECRLLTPDRMGITGWQKFCRKAVAQSELVNDVETWVMCAPTARHLRQLTDMVIDQNFAKRLYSVNICDLSHIQNLAIGTYVASDDINRDRLVLQQQLEEISAEYMRLHVQSMVSTQNWGSILAEALNKNPDNDDPFRRPDDIRRVNQASNSDAVLLLWVKSLSPRVSYSFPCTRLTDQFPAFDEGEPSKPDEPNPNERLYGIAGPHIYPGENSEERKNSEKYRNAYHKWKYEEMSEYDKDVQKWEQAKREWERKRSAYHVNYEFSVESLPQVSLSGYLKIVDTVGEQRLLWSTEVSLERTGETKTVKRIPVQVIGDETAPSRPNDIENYRNLYKWQDCFEAISEDTMYSVGQDVMLSSFREAIKQLPDIALWTGDLKPWNQSLRSEKNSAVTSANIVSANNDRLAVANIPVESVATKANTQSVEATAPTPVKQTEIVARNIKEKLMLPLADIASWLGATKRFDSKTNSVFFTLGDRVVSVKLYSTSAWIDGKPVTMEAPLSVVENVGYVPKSFIEQAFSITIHDELGASSVTVKHPLSDEQLVLRIK